MHIGRYSPERLWLGAASHRLNPSPCSTSSGVVDQSARGGTMRRVGAESKLSTASPAWADRRLLRPGFPVCRVLRRTHRKVGPTAERSRPASGRKGPRRRARYGSCSTCIAVPAGSARRSLALACRRCRGGIAREVPAALLGRALVKVCGPSRCTGRGLAQQRNGRLRLEVGMPAVAFLIGLGKDTAVDGDDWNRPA